MLGSVRPHLTDVATSELTHSKRNLLAWAALSSLPAFALALPRLWRLAQRFARGSHFLPACRVLSTVAYYLRFRRLLAHPAGKAVFIANHYSPECLALASAAHRAGKKVIFANHANATWRSGYVPQLHCDLAVVTSQAVLDLYTRDRDAEIPAVYLPVQLRQRPMQSRIVSDGGVAVGIFLTALTNLERLQALVASLVSNPQVCRVLIRSHPAAVVNEDLSDYFRADNGVEDTTAMTLSDNIDLCDLAICGNSTVTIEILRGGVPVLYDDALDGLPADYNGYLENGIVLAMPAELDAAAFESIAGFYGAASWPTALRYFDAGYQQDEGVMLQRVNDAIRAVVEEARNSRAPQNVAFGSRRDGLPAANLQERPFRV